MPDPMDLGYWWFPGDARSDRGYTREEALAAVGSGWRSLAEEAWQVVTEAGGEVVQVKQKFGALRVYYRVPPEVEGEVWGQICALENRSRDICEFCGEPGPGECDACRSMEHDWSEMDALRQWIPGEPRRDRPSWMRPLLLEPGTRDWDLIQGAALRKERSWGEEGK